MSIVQFVRDASNLCHSMPDDPKNAESFQQRSYGRYIFSRGSSFKLRNLAAITIVLI